MLVNKKITIIGLGGVGGYFGFKIAQKYQNDNNVEVTFIARNETFKVVKEKGFRLISPEISNINLKPDRIFDNLSEINEADLILICVKEYDLEKVCEHLCGKIKKEAILLPLMNGVDIYDRIRKKISIGRVLPSCVYVASHIIEKGIVEHKGNPGKIVFGKDPLFVDFRPEWVIELFEDCKIDAIYKDNSYPDIWTKFLFIASFGLVSARYNKSIGQINENIELRARAKAIMQEILQITAKKTVNLPRNIIDQTFQKAETFPYSTPTSLQLDIQVAKSTNELELFAGAIMNYGKQLNISVNETEKIYYEIRELKLKL